MTPHWIRRTSRTAPCMLPLLIILQYQLLCRSPLLFASWRTSPAVSVIASPVWLRVMGWNNSCNTPHRNLFMVDKENRGPQRSGKCGHSFTIFHPKTLSCRQERSRLASRRCCWIPARLCPAPSVCPASAGTTPASAPTQRWGSLSPGGAGEKRLFKKEGNEQIVCTTS